MNAVESLVCTGTLPIARIHSVAAFTAVSSVRMVRTTSTSFMSGTGLKKCSPSTCPERRVAAAMAVTLQEDVVLATVAGGGQTRSSLAKVSFFSCWFSVIASTTRSQSLRSSRRVVPLSRPSVSSFPLASSLPLATRPSRVLRRLPRPRCSSSSFASTTVVRKPAWAATCAIPEPMRPHPRTPTCLMAIGSSRDGARPASRTSLGEPREMRDQGERRLIPRATARQRRRLVVGGPRRARGPHRHADAAVLDAADALPRADGVLVHRQRVAPVLQLVFDLDGLGRELSQLADRHEPGP